MSHQGQVVSLTGGGHCGWNCTEEAIEGGEDSFKRGGWHLQLALPPVEKTDFDLLWLLEGLPNEILIAVLSYFDVEDLATASVVCKRLLRLVRSVCTRTIECGGHEVTLTVLPGERFYLPLPRHEESASSAARINFSSCQRNHEVFSIWKKVRIDPATLRVHTGDTTFAETVGMWSQASPSGFIPYGSCYACDGPQCDYGKCNIDLRGTPFQVVSKFRFGGYQAYVAAEKPYNSNRECASRRLVGCTVP